MKKDYVRQAMAGFPPLPRKRPYWKPKPTGYKAHEPTTLYRLYGEGRELLYIGISGNPKSRLDKHRATKPWWGEVAKIETVLYPTRDEARWMEKVQVLLEMPKHNTIYVMRDGDYGTGGWQAPWDVPHVHEEDLKRYRKLRRLALECQELEHAWAPRQVEWLWAQARELSSLSNEEFSKLRMHY